jgi:hypothetical protein
MCMKRMIMLCNGNIFVRCDEDGLDLGRLLTLIIV